MIVWRSGEDAPAYMAYETEIAASECPDDVTTALRSH